jgi:hypothetical protein
LGQVPPRQPRDCTHTATAAAGQPTSRLRQPGTADPARGTLRPMSAPPPDQVPDNWDFYPCQVDDAPASIFLNLWFAEHDPPATADHLYICDVAILDPDEHGMGAAEEADALWDAEDAFTSQAAGLGLYYVGRVRNHGRWMMALYGPAGFGEKLGPAAATAFAPREVIMGGQDDASWSYYVDFLYPDAERLQWIQNRRVVAALEEHGDTLEEPRQVDHWIYFESGAARQRFLDAVQPEGFVVQTLHADGTPPRIYAAQVYRVDHVDLGAIHEVVMFLHRAAADSDGEYDGWETQVMAGGSP